MADGQGAAAEAGQGVCLVPGAGDGAGQVQGLPVTPFGLRGVTADLIGIERSTPGQEPEREVAPAPESMSA